MPSGRLRTRFWLLAGLRWLPTGFVIPVSALLPLKRGLTIAEYGMVAATQGFVVLLLELPTGGFADALGRKPVFVASAVVALASYVVAALAQVTLAFVGRERAERGCSARSTVVPSTPGSSTRCTRTSRSRTATPRSCVGLSGYASVVGASIAVGAVISRPDHRCGRRWAGRTPWPCPTGSPRHSPMVQIVVAMVLMHEDRSARVAGLPAARSGPRHGSSSTAPGSCGARGSCAALVAVELFWGFGMIAFESFMPIRLSELLVRP